MILNEVTSSKQANSPSTVHDITDIHELHDFLYHLHTSGNRFYG